MNQKLANKFKKLRFELIRDIYQLVDAQSEKSISLGDTCYRTYVPDGNEVVVTEQFHKVYVNPDNPDEVMVDYTCCEGYYPDGPCQNSYSESIEFMSMDELFEIILSLPADDHAES